MLLAVADIGQLERVNPHLARAGSDVGQGRGRPDGLTPTEPAGSPVPSATTRLMTEQVSVTRQIVASARQVWAIVSDVTRMGQ